MPARKDQKSRSKLLLTAFFLSLLFFCQSASAADIDHEHINRQIWDRGAKWWAGETSVSRLPHELRQKRVGLKVGALQSLGQTSPALQAPSAGATAPGGSFNWTTYNYVTPVRDQGNCGSCWAFATTAALESQVAMAKNGLQLNLSEQILVSCSGAGDCEQGGYVNEASTFIKNTGLPLETCFPYTQTDNNCSNACSNWQSNTYGIMGWHWVAPVSVTNLKNALYTYGPLVVSMTVYDDFYAYAGGVYSHVSGPYSGEHAIELVGYNDTLQCFIAKNSWGAGWGEAGFFKIAYTEVTSVVHFGAYTIAYDGYKAMLSSISITGAALVSEGTTSTYSATATYGDGTSKAITPSWSVSPAAYATINSSGVLTANQVTVDRTVTVNASYTENGITKTTSKTVTIVNGALSTLSISGASSLFEGSTATYTATATYANGTSKTVTPTWSLSSTTYAGISTGGVLTAGQVSSDQGVIVNASYTESGVTKTASLPVTIQNIVLSNLAISGPTSVYEAGSATYTATATYSNGTSTTVTPIWSLSSTTYAAINASGVLTAASAITGNHVVTVNASFSDGGVTKTASLQVTIIDAVLSSLAINGPTSVKKGTTATYTASATYSDGKSAVVTPAWSLSSTTYAVINAGGVLTAGDVTENQIVMVNASYTQGGITKTASKQVTITDPKLDPIIFLLLMGD